MNLQLFYSPASPYVRKVLVAARERGVIDQIELLDSAANPVNRDTRVVAHNPSGKVPCLLIENGRPLFDSRVICLYLDSLAEGPSLYPSDRLRFDVLTLEALGDALLDAALLCRYERMSRPAELRWQDWYDGQIAKIDSGLDDIESRRMDLLGGQFHIGAIAVACVLGYLDFRFSDKDWRSGHPALAAWFAAVSERDSLKATAPPRG